MLLTIFVILLVLWLLGVIGNFTFGGLIHLLLIVALVVLVLSLAERGARRTAFQFNRNIGLLLTGVWLILFGLPTMVSFSFPGQGMVLAVLAIVAGVFLVLGR